MFQITEEKQNTDDIASTLKRDYVKMETDLSGKIDDTKTEVELLQEKLANTQAELRREKVCGLITTDQYYPIFSDISLRLGNIQFC